MATGNILSICNRALISAGSRVQVSSLNENSTQSNACNTLFTPTFEALARTASWNCLRKQATLTLLAAAAGTPENTTGSVLPIPPSPWLYQYQIPSDCLDARFLLPTFTNNTGTVPISASMYAAPGTVPGKTQIPFIVALAADTSNNPLQVILTNLDTAQIVYTANQPNPQVWDSLFQSAMVASLAVYLGFALSLNEQMSQRNVALADKMISQARVRDGDEGSTVQDHIPDWITARSGGNYYGAGSYQYGYQNMMWPG